MQTLRRDGRDALGEAAVRCCAEDCCRARDEHGNPEGVDHG